jgi:aerobic carbon-monoxide dehydrogenase medium subunit
MIPAAFEYYRPTEISQAIELLEKFGDDAKLLAGGQSLIPTMKVRMAQPQYIIDLAGIQALKGISVENDYLRIGATTTHWEVESSAVVKSVIPVLSEVASIIADPLVRNRGTMGGSISNADPAADYPASVLALDAELVCTGSAGTRIVSGADWFQGLFTTALGENEILQEIHFPLPQPRTAAAYLKLPHPASRFAVVGVLAKATVDEEGRCTAVRIGITGAGTHAVRATSSEETLLGKIWSPSTIEAASKCAADQLDVNEDLHFSAEDRRHLCAVYVKRALTEVMRRVGERKFLRNVGEASLGRRIEAVKK